MFCPAKAILLDVNLYKSDTDASFLPGPCPYAHYLSRHIFLRYTISYGSI